MKDTSNKSNTLNNCPFCGQSCATIVSNFEVVNMFISELTDDQEEEIESDSYFFVICDASEGGCGAMSGAGEDEEEAITKWNRV